VLMHANGIPMLLHLVRRLRAVPSLDAIVIATTINAADDPIAEFAAHEEVAVFRGSESDVLGRVIGAARSAEADIVVEITGDCPIIDPDLVEQTIRTFLQHEADYVSNSVVRSYPDGMDTQVMAFAALQRAADLSDDPLDHEHVSRFIYQHPDIFSLVHVVAPPSLTWPNLGLTLDDARDYELLKRVIEHLAPHDDLFGCGAAIAFLKSNPDLLEINRQVVRKGDQ
jgi:spore coat polysaccharide biosynthesis protein SpsF